MTRKPLSRMLKDEEGAILVWLAIALPAVLLVASLAIDMSYGYFTRSKLQTTASSAALAGAGKLPLPPAPDDPPLTQDEKDAIVAAVVAEAQVYGTDKNDGLGLQGTYLVDGDVVVGNWNESAAQGSEFTPNGTPFNAVQVTTRRTNSGGNEVNLLLATAIGEVDVNTPAVATLDGGEIVGDACLLLLDPTGSESLRLNGGIDIQSVECGICVNSSASDALRGNGAAGVVSLDFTQGSESGFVHVHGGAVLSNTTINPEEETGKPICDNPYEDVAVDYPEFQDRFAFDNCASSVAPVISGSTVTFPPGVHCSGGNEFVYDGGTSEVIFEAGVHHFIGEIRGDPLEFSVLAGAGISSQDPGVTLLLTNTALEWGGAGEINLTANSTDGQGFLTFQNPADPVQNVTHNISGNVDAGLVGIQNYGRQNLEFEGNVGTADTSLGGCTVIVAERAIFNGGGNSSHFLDSTGCNDQDPPKARNERFYRLVN
ncbi:MAG: pilus assembly protein TadG-related protein [Pseudomonadota bacterium]